MRMRELAQRAAMPRTTIHHYLREKLLPEPVRTARNAATYTEEHLDRLRLIRRLRSRAGARLPLAQVRRVLELAEQGVDVDLAVGLQQALLGESLAPQAELMTLAEVTRESGLDEREVGELLQASVIIPALEDQQLFDAADLELLRTYARLQVEIDLRLDEMAAIAQRIGEVSAIEMAMRNRAVEGLDCTETSLRSLDLQKAANLTHSYLFARNRQRNVDALPRRHTTEESEE